MGFDLFDFFVFQELSKITMPVVFNEPLTFLQRITEYLEYATLLETAAAQDNPVDRMMVRKIENTVNIVLVRTAKNNYFSLCTN